MKKILFVTGNQEKVKEAEAILGVPIQIIKLELDEVQSMDLGYVARKKVEAAFAALQKPVMVDDVGVKIDAFNGFPGPFVKFLLENLGLKKLLKLLENEKDRGIIVQNAIGYHDGKRSHVFIGEFKGTIATEERGTDGWGFDVVVIPEGEKLTLAELGTLHKNKMSHRALSLFKFKEYLDSQKTQNEV